MIGSSSRDLYTTVHFSVFSIIMSQTNQIRNSSRSSPFGGSGSKKTASGSPSEAMLEMLRKHKQDVHRIANLAAEISIATETGVGIQHLSTDQRNVGSAERGRLSSPFRMQQLQDRSLTGGGSITTPIRTGSPSIGSSLIRTSLNASLSSPATMIGSPSSTKRQNQQSLRLSNRANAQTSPTKSSPTKTVAYSNILNVQSTKYQSSSDGKKDVDNVDIKKLSPEQKQKKMRHAVHDLYQTVQDQRTRAEARGLTLPRAL
jgi:hypothetical protein